MARSHIAVDTEALPLSRHDRLAALLGGKWGDWLSLLAGGMLPLAFAPFDFFPAAVIAPALLFMSWLDIRPRRALRRGFLFGLGMFGVGVNWVFVSMYEYGGVSLLLSLFLTTLLVAFLALFPAVLAYLLVRWFPFTGAAAAVWRLAVVFLGLLFGVYGFLAYGRFSNGATVLTVLGMFLFFIGLLADQISIMNRKKN